MLQFSHQQLKEIELTLSTEPQSRTVKKLLALNTHFRHVSVFSKLQEESETLLALYKNLKFLRISKGETIFEFGDDGDLFYIVLSGEVSIYTPHSVLLTDKQLQPSYLL